MHIVERDQWGARAPRGAYQHVTWSPGGLLVLHHTASAPLPAGASPAAEAAQVRAFQRQHQDVNGWNDIGYHFLVAPSGRVYRGRPEQVMGAHCPGWNQYPGVALIGNYSEHEPSRNQAEAIDRLGDWFRVGTLVGHRDNYATSCPGDAAYRALVEDSGRDLEPVWPPHGDTLALNVAGHPAFPRRGWKDCAGALRAIARDGLQPEPAGAGEERHWIEWRGGRWTGARQVTGVARRLVRDELGEEA